MPPRTEDELYGASHKFLVENGHKVSFKFGRLPAGTPAKPQLQIDGRNISRQGLISLAATYPGFKYFKC